MATLIINVMSLLTAFHTVISGVSHIHTPGAPDLLFVEWLDCLQYSAAECRWGALTLPGLVPVVGAATSKS